MSHKEYKSGSHSITTTKSSSFYDETTGETYVTRESWTAKEHQNEHKRSFSEYWGIGRYFIIICLIIFFIAPVYTELNNNWTWEVKSSTHNNGAITHYEYYNPKHTQDFINLGNDMMEGFVTTMNNLSTTVEVTEKVQNVFSWVKNMQDKIMGVEIVNKFINWIAGLFG